MHTSSPEIAEIQLPKAGRRHARYSDDFKRKVVAACLEPGVSKAAIALANGLNANMLRRLVTGGWSVVITFSLVSYGADMDPIGILDFKENDIVSRPKRDNQLSGEWTSICFAATKWANRQKLTCLANSFFAMNYINPGRPSTIVASAPTFHRAHLG